jgi:excisionase family DNA binding protein
MPTRTATPVAETDLDTLASWLSVDEFATRAGVATKTVRRWIAAGRLTVVRMGPKLLRIDPNDLHGLTTPSPSS